ncbi:MAG: hypothetical protein ACYDCG_10710 [Candidatus Acidiferrales bacterium]
MIYTDVMGNSSKPSASVIAAGVIAILGSLFVLLGSGLSLVAFLLVKLPATLPQQPSFVRIAGVGLMALGMACGIFGIAAGIGLFLLRNWGRISAMVWAGICFFFGLIGIPVALFMSVPTASNSPGMPGNFTLIFRLILLAIYGAPLVVGIWWLVLFNRKSVKEQFARTAAPVDLSLRQKPRPPVAITILAWFFITSAANIVILPFLPFRPPAMLFGHLFYGPAGTVILAVSCIFVAVVGIGLLKLKPWSFPLAIGLQLFWLASGIISLLNPNFDFRMNSMIGEMIGAMRLPDGVFAPLDFLHHMRLFMYIGLLIPVAIVAMLFYCRERFLEAASAAKP